MRDLLVLQGRRTRILCTAGPLSIRLRSLHTVQGLWKDGGRLFQGLEISESDDLPALCEIFIDIERQSAFPQFLKAIG